MVIGSRPGLPVTVTAGTSVACITWTCIIVKNIPMWWCSGLWTALVVLECHSLIDHFSLTGSSFAFRLHCSASDTVMLLMESHLMGDQRDATFKTTWFPQCTLSSFNYTLINPWLNTPPHPTTTFTPFFNLRPLVISRVVGHRHSCSTVLKWLVGVSEWL